MSDVRDIIARTAREFGGGLNVDPVALALATAKQESGFNNEAVGDQGHSVGPFQENDQGAGYGKSFAERTDPIETTKRFLRRAFKAQQDGYVGAGAIAAAAQKPYDSVGYARSVDALYAGFVGETYIGGGTTSAVIGDPQCPPGYHRSLLGACVKDGFVPDLPLPSLPTPTPGAKVTDAGNPFDAIGQGFGSIGASISDIGDRALTGTRQLIIAGVVVGAVVALSVAGVRRTLS